MACSPGPSGLNLMGHESQLRAKWGDWREGRKQKVEETGERRKGQRGMRSRRMFRTGYLRIKKSLRLFVHSLSWSSTPWQGLPHHPKWYPHTIPKEWYQGKKHNVWWLYQEIREKPALRPSDWGTRQDEVCNTKPGWHWRHTEWNHSLDWLEGALERWP